MAYTVHMQIPGGGLTAWDDEVYDDPDAALEVARSAYESREGRRNVYVLGQDGRAWDWFKAYKPEPALTATRDSDGRPVHFTRTEALRMMALLSDGAFRAQVATARRILSERLADTDRMLAAWDGTPVEETDR